MRGLTKVRLAEKVLPKSFYKIVSKTSGPEWQGHLV